MKARQRQQHICIGMGGSGMANAAKLRKEILRHTYVTYKTLERIITLLAMKGA